MRVSLTVPGLVGQPLHDGLGGDHQQEAQGLVEGDDRCVFQEEGETMIERGTRARTKVWVRRLSALKDRLVIRFEREQLFSQRRRRQAFWARLEWGGVRRW